MIALYRIELRLRSALGTPLSADTLWGHIAWGIRYREGEEALAAWLARHELPEPPLILSDPMPRGYWPRPAVPPPPRPSTAPSAAEAQLRKQLAAIEWLPEDVWLALAEGLSSNKLFAAVKAALHKQPVRSVIAPQTHAGVNRLTGGTTAEDGGTLFATERRFFNAGAIGESPRYVVWAYSPAESTLVQRWFEDGLIGGYGRDGANGAGWIEVLEVSTAALPEVPNANAVVTLAPFTPKPGDPIGGFFRAGVRCGRLGGDFAIGPTPDGSSLRQKRPVASFLTGTLLACPPQDYPAGPPSTVGRILAGVHRYADIRQYAAAVTLPCRLEDGLADHPLLNPASQQEHAQ
ncbi:hypothetical protein [Botrimarina hoheduenensis]|uniref:Uncharacterized protein n=1 Tax=Botrimarina hoheduenensis TaxID=2528000 RepID=A0A5C5VRL8_9BACT|nr:hypothetical protein [Botrimarina hoheduenensis]TWT40212.1 hypothetical protein Pla111_33430 [Botrimarina hoheduenensis]